MTRYTCIDISRQVGSNAIFFFFHMEAVLYLETNKIIILRIIDMIKRHDSETPKYKTYPLFYHFNCDVKIIIQSDSRNLR